MDESFTPPDDDAEHWLPVPDWEGLYEVSDKSRVRSLDRTVAVLDRGQRRIPGRILRQWTNTAGHPSVTLNRVGGKEHWRVSSLVRETFDPPVIAPWEELERWLPVPGHEEWYDVSDLGRVRSWHLPHGARGRRKRPYLLTPVLKGNGYLMVALNRDGQVEDACVHVLVLTAFVGPRPPGWIEARHGPAGKLDNSLANLCWGTMQENHQDRTRDDAVVWGERHGNAKLTVAAVIECRERRAAGERLIDLAREFGVSPSGLCQAVKGTTWRLLVDHDK